MRQAAVISRSRCVVKWRISFAERNDLSVVTKRKKFSKTPDAAAVARIERSTSLLPDFAQRSRVERFTPLYIKQPAATRAHVKAGIKIEFGAAIGSDAALYMKIGAQRRAL